MKIRLTKEFNFEMSHVLHAYDGLCRNIHGHSYRLFVTVLGEPLNQKDNP
ncbi:MAG TPA: 6-carboxytetrahydropterin synthase QueD, partial [Bacteroidales bacterium]|nr:6-carboxytetrahydropterin synthase QueD [Bacteroidales bacterium]